MNTDCFFEHIGCAYPTPCIPSQTLQPYKMIQPFLMKSNNLMNDTLHKQSDYSISVTHDLTPTCKVKTDTGSLILYIR